MTGHREQPLQVIHACTGTPKAIGRVPVNARPASRLPLEFSTGSKQDTLAPLACSHCMQAVLASGTPVEDRLRRAVLAGCAGRIAHRMDLHNGYRTVSPTAYACAVPAALQPSACRPKGHNAQM